VAKSRSAQLVIVADAHIGSTIGLAPKKIELDDGAIVGQNSLQEIVWDFWSNEFWPLVHKEAKKRDTAVVLNGDLVDGPAHHGVTAQWSSQILDQINVAAEIFAPIANKYPVYVTRGTAAHVLASGAADEQIAKEIGAQSPSGRNTRSSYHLKLNFHNVLFDFAHHGPGPGNRVWTYGSQLRGYAKTIIFDALIRHVRPPDVIVRSHVHHRVWETIRDYSHKCEALITPAWQLKTDFAHRVVSHEDIADIGGIIVSIDDGKISDINFKMLPISQSDTVTI
jgi:hypothetical protein